MIYAMTSPYGMFGKVADTNEKISIKDMCKKVTDWLVELEREHNPETVIDGVKYEVEGLNVIISYRHRHPNFHSSISVQLFQIDDKYAGVESGVPLHNLYNSLDKFDLLPITGLSETIPLDYRVHETGRERRLRKDREEDVRLAQKWENLI